MYITDEGYHSFSIKASNHHFIPHLLSLRLILSGKAIKMSYLGYFLTVTEDKKQKFDLFLVEAEAKHGILLAQHAQQVFSGVCVNRC